MVVLDQLRNASLQLSTASIISALVLFGTKPITSFVAYMIETIDKIDHFNELIAYRIGKFNPIFSF
jgi:hypothetical protein